MAKKEIRRVFAVRRKKREKKRKERKKERKNERKRKAKRRGEKVDNPGVCDACSNVGLTRLGRMPDRFMVIRANRVKMYNATG